MPQNRKKGSQTPKTPVKGLLPPVERSTGVSAQEVQTASVFCLTMPEAFEKMGPRLAAITMGLLDEAKAMGIDAPQFITIDVKEMAKRNNMQPSELSMDLFEIGRYMMATNNGAWIRILCPVWVANANGDAEMALFVPPINHEPGGAP